MNQLTYANYMENLARESRFILHSDSDRRFYKMTSIDSLEQVLTNLLNAKTPALGINDTFEGRLIQNDSDLIVDRQLYTFYVFGRNEFLNHSQRKEQNILLKQISLVFSNRIISDCYSDFALKTNFGLRYLDVNSFTYRTLASLPDGLTAIISSFVVDQPTNPGIANEFWND